MTEKTMSQSPYADFLKANVGSDLNQLSSVTSVKQKLLIDNCTFCNHFINAKSDTLVSFGKCGHQFHGKCLALVAFCPECEHHQTVELPVMNSFFQPSAPLVSIDDQELKTEHVSPFETMQQRPVVPVKNDKPARDLNRKLNKKIVQALETAFKAPLRFGFDYFIDNKITIKQLIDHGIALSLDDFYHVFDITEWSQLLKLRITPKHLLRGACFPIERLATHYNVDYFVLKSDFKPRFQKKNQTFLSFLALHRFTPTELKQMGLTFELMISEGLNKTHLKMWQSVPFVSWIKELGATKEHFLDHLEIKSNDVQTLGWNLLEFQSAMQLNFSEYERFNNRKSSFIKVNNKYKKDIKSQ